MTKGSCVFSCLASSPILSPVLLAALLLRGFWGPPDPLNPWQMSLQAPAGNSAQRVRQGGSPGSCWPLLDSWGLCAEREQSGSDLLTLELSGHQQGCPGQMPAEPVSQSERDGFGGCKCPGPLLGRPHLALPNPTGSSTGDVPWTGSEVPEWLPSGLALCSPLARGWGRCCPRRQRSSRSIFNFLSLSRAQGSGPLALGPDWVSGLTFWLNCSGNPSRLKQGRSPRHSAVGAGQAKITLDGRRGEPGSA